MLGHLSFLSELAIPEFNLRFREGHSLERAADY